MESILREKAEWAIDKTPLLDDTVQHCIKTMPYNAEEKLLACVHASIYFASQMDETTDLQSMNHLLAYVQHTREKCSTFFPAYHRQPMLHEKIFSV